MPEPRDGFALANPTPTLMGRLLRAFFADLERAKIRYCVLRNHEGLPDHTTHDVDLLVEPSRATEAIAFLAQAAQDGGWLLVRSPRRFRYGALFLSCAKPQDSTKYPLLQVDFWWSDHLWRALPIVASNMVLETCQTYRSLRVASLGPSAAVTFAKEYLQNGRLGNGEKLARNQSRIVQAVKRDRAAFVGTLRPGFGLLLAERIASRIAAGDWGWFRRQHCQVQCAVVMHSLLRNPARQIVNWARFLRGHFDDKLLRPSGLMVAFCGPDGSGKTTMALALERAIREQLVEAFPVVTYRHGHFGVLPELKAVYNAIAARLGLRKKEELTIEESTQLLDGPPFHPLRAMAYLVYYTLDYLLGYVVVWRERAASHVLIFDRYGYDYLIHSTFDRVPKAVRWALLFLLPRPQLVVYLKGDPDAIHRRKPELRPDQIAAQQARCEEIVRHTPNACVCGADGGVEQTLACVLDAFCRKAEDQSRSKLQRSLS